MPRDPVALLRKYRVDAEDAARDKTPGVDLLRGWLRAIHLELVGGWDQNTSQDELAKLLGEHPREHPRFGKIDPSAVGSSS